MTSMITEEIGTQNRQPLFTIMVLLMELTARQWVVKH